MTDLRSIIYDKLKQDNLSVLNLNSQIENMSEFAKLRITEDFKQYGLSVELFNIINITVKEDDPSFRRLKEAKDAAAKIKIIGRENYQMTRSFDVLEKAAKNEGGGAINTAVGIGAELGIGNQVGTIAARTMNLYPDDVPPIPTIDYYLVIDGKRQGSMAFDAVERKVTDGEVNENTLVWKKGLKSWIKIGECEDFTHLFDENCPPPIPIM